MTNDESRLRLADYLSHMLEAARLAREYVEDVVKDDFLDGRRTQQAVVLNLITIGEAASRIVSDYSDFAAAHSEIPCPNARHAQPHGARLLRYCHVQHPGELQNSCSAAATGW